ncbi:MAG: serine/threonine protein kinase [Clostridia bacterium]|nr:serine/threonine protein kinase [Clostridia bacterium]
MTDKKLNIEQELLSLKTENDSLRKFIRPETLKLLKLKEIGEIEKNIKKSLYLKYLYIPIIILIILSVGAFSILYFKFDFNTEPLINDPSLNDPDFISDSSPESYNIYGNTVGNTFNSGLLTTQDNWIYFSEGNKIYKTDNIEKEPFKITDSTDSDLFVDLNISGNWLYYIDKNTGYICKIRTDGKNKTILFEEPVKQLMVYKNFIYFIDGQNQIQRILINGDKYRNVLKNIPILFFYINNNIIYYIADLSEKKAIIAHDPAKDTYYSISGTDSDKMIFHDGFVYFSENGYLYRIKPDGTSKQIILTESSNIYNIIGDKIFYISEETKSLVRVDTDGTDKIAISSPLFDSINNIYNVQDKFLFLKTNKGIYYTNIYEIEFNLLSEVE